MGKSNRAKSRKNRALKRQSQTKPLRYYDVTEDPFSDFGDENYKELSEMRNCVFKNYVHGKNLHRSTYGLALVRPENSLPVIVISSELKMDATVGTDVTKICPSDKGLNLDKRCAAFLGLKPDESFEVRWDGIDGDLIVMMFRNVFTPREAQAAGLFKQEHVLHSKGWNRGCEADLIPRENTTRRQINNPDMILGTSGINPDNSLVSVGPGGIGRTTGIRVHYHNGKRAPGIPFSSFLNRFKWVRTGTGDDGHKYDQFLRRSENIAAAKYFEKLKAIYMRHCLAFMGEKYKNCLNEVEASLLMNTNIIDDVDSTMAIHKDPTTPTPALAAGPSNYVFDEVKEEWTLSHNGGRLYIAEGLFWIDYCPTDVALFDGNVPHGVSRLRPRGVDKSQSVVYERFSIILFSKFRRTGGMRKHGHFRHCPK